MADAHKNFAYSTVLTAPVTATAGTALTVQVGDGALFPTVPFNATVWPTASQPTSANAEIVRVTNITGDVLTITRTQESSTNRSIVVGDQIAATITNLTLTDAQTDWVNLLGANTAGNTTASGSTLGLSGINLTLSGTNASIINISAPATSSLVGTNGISISSNGSTISISQIQQTFNSSVFGLGNRGATGSVSLGQNSLYFWPHIQEMPLQGSIIKMPVLVTLSSSAAGAFTRGHTASFAAYSRSATDANSTALTRIYSTSYTAAAVFSSNANMSISVITAVGNSTSYSSVAANSAGLNLSLSVHGAREFIMPWNTTITAGEYWFAFAQSSSSAGGVGNVFNVSHSVMSAATVNAMGLSTAASNNGIDKNIGFGTYSATSANFPNSLPITDIRGGATLPIVHFLQGTA